MSTAGYLSLTDADRDGDARGDRRRVDRRAVRADPRGGALRAHARRARGAARGRARAAPRGARVERNADTSRRAQLPRDGDLRPLRPGDRGHVPLPRRVPHGVHAVPAGDEPGRPPGDLRVPDRDLRAHGDGRLERLGLRRHDRRRRRVLHRPPPHGPLEGRARRDAQPAGAPGREDVRPGVRHGRGRGAARRGHDRSGGAGRRGGGRRRRRSSSSRTRSAASSPRRTSPPRAADAGALPVAHVDLASLGLLEAPGNYGCAMAIGEGQSIGNYQSYGGPHYGFLAARKEFIRRMPGRIVGETTDLEGSAASSSRSRPASSTSAGRRRRRT